MTVYEGVVLGQGSPEVASSQSQTDPVPSAVERKTLRVASPLTPSLHEPVPTHRPPPELLDEQGNLQQFHVERLLKRRRHKGQYQYLVKWRGYPKSKNSWFEVPLRQDCPYAVDIFDRRAEGQLASQRASHQ